MNTAAALLALCPTDELAILSDEQVRSLRRKIRAAIYKARLREGLVGKQGHRGRPISSTHPRAKYWREWKRRSAALAAEIDAYNQAYDRHIHPEAIAGDLSHDLPRPLGVLNPCAPPPERLGCATGPFLGGCPARAAPAI